MTHHIIISYQENVCNHITHIFLLTLKHQSKNQTTNHIIAHHFCHHGRLPHSIEKEEFRKTMSLVVEHWHIFKHLFFCNSTSIFHDNENIVFPSFHIHTLHHYVFCVLNRQLFITNCHPNSSITLQQLFLVTADHLYTRPKDHPITCKIVDTCHGCVTRSHFTIQSSSFCPYKQQYQLI